MLAPLTGFKGFGFKVFWVLFELLTLGLRVDVGVSKHTTTPLKPQVPKSRKGTPHFAKPSYRIAISFMSKVFGSRALGGFGNFFGTCL